MSIEEIKELLKSGDVAGAEKAAQELLAAEPDNVRAMMLYGTCRQLQGDEATFRDTYRAVKEHLEAHPDALDAETEAAWKRFGTLYAKLDQPELRRRGTPSLMEWAFVAILVATVGVVSVSYFCRDTQGLLGILGRVIWGREAELAVQHHFSPADCNQLYGGPKYNPNIKFTDIRNHSGL